MQIKIIYIIIIKIIIITTLCSNNLKNNNYKNNTLNKNKNIIENQNIIGKKQVKNNTQENIIGNIIIPSINLKNNLYNISSKENNIEKNVTILKGSKDPNNKNSLIIIAAHSGEGKIAYFNNLNNLKINDDIILNYYNKKYTFKVLSIFEQNKIGYINIQKKEISQLILTTCSLKNKNKQLIIEAIKSS